MVDIDPERLRHAVGGDVVMGRSDSAGREHVGVPMPQRIKGGHDVGLVVGDDANLLQVDADIGQVFGDEADVLVLGPAGQDLVADHQYPCRDDLAHGLIP